MRNLFPVSAVLSGLLLLTACGGKEIIDTDPTLAQLESRATLRQPAQQQATVTRADIQRSYEALARSTDNPELRAIALERLADIDLDNAQDVISGELEGASSSESPSTETAAVPDSPANATVAVLTASGNLPKAIAQYEEVLSLYPDYPGNERVLYQLAWAYELSGDLDKTLETLTTLLIQFPQSEHRDEAQFRRGEILFAYREYEQAEAAYADVLAMGDTSSFYERSQFKHGWAVFKQGNTRRALDSYFGVLDRNFVDGRDLDDFSRSERELLQDTLRIISLSFSYLKGAESITTFFDEYGAREYEHRIYRDLSQLYVTQERVDDAVETLMSFIRRYPQHAQSSLLTVRVIELFELGKRPEELLLAKADLINHYGIGTGYWADKSPELLSEVRPHLQKNLDDLSSHFHARAQRSKKPADYRVAAQWYRVYVNSFPEDTHTPYRNFLLAESLYDSGDITSAATEFEKTAYHYLPHEKSAEAGYAALLAHRKQIDTLKAGAQRQKRLDAISSGQRFITAFPQDPRVLDVTSSTAEALFDLQQYNEAVMLATRVVNLEPRPNDKLLRINWAIIAQGEFEQGHYAQAEAASIQRLGLLPANDKERDNDIERLAAAIYKQGEQAREAGHNLVAAGHFLRVGQLAPNSSVRPNADYDAATAYHAEQSWAQAIPVLQDFIQNYPRHELRAGAEEKLAVAHQQSGNWTAAADATIALFAREPDAEKKRLLLWQIAEFYQKAENPTEAVAVYKRYVKTYPAPYDDAVEARHRLAEIYASTGETGKRHYWLEQIIKVDKQGPSTDRSRYLAAVGALELAEPTYQEFRRVKLTQPLKENLKKKKALMQDSLKAYTLAAGYEIETVTTTSTYRIGEIYNEFSRGLFDSERPQGLNDEELEQYEILLEEQAYPFEEKAIEIHEVNAKRASVGTYDEWVRKSFEALGKLSPVRYAKHEKSEVADETLE